eukprot:3917546-Rhodomonas_salina.1
MVLPAELPFPTSRYDWAGVFDWDTLILSSPHQVATPSPYLFCTPESKAYALPCASYALSGTVLVKVLMAERMLLACTILRWRMVVRSTGWWSTLSSAAKSSLAPSISKGTALRTRYALAGTD